MPRALRMNCGLLCGPLRRGSSRAFSLVELMMVVALLGILAAVIVPKFSNASNAARDTSIRSQLRLMREQIGIFEASTGAHFAPAGATGWDQLLNAGLIRQVPRNEVFGGATIVAVSPGAGVGWLWAPLHAGNPSALWAVDATGVAIYPE